MAKPKTRDNLLYGEEIYILKNSCETYEEKLLILGLLNSGMRISEFIHMRKEWLDWSGKLIKIPSSMPCLCYECKKELWTRSSKKTGEKELKKPKGIWMPKTKNGARSIPILPEIEPLFKEYFATKDSMMQLIPNRIKGWKIIKEVAKKSKIAKILFPHCLRGVFVTQLLDKGFDYMTITNVLGWDDIKIVMKYAKYSSGMIVNEFNKKW